MVKLFITAEGGNFSLGSKPISMAHVLPNNTVKQIKPKKKQATTVAATAIKSI